MHVNEGGRLRGNDCRPDQSARTAAVARCFVAPFVPAMRGQPRNASRNNGGGDGDGDWLCALLALALLGGTTSPLPLPAGAALRGVDVGDGPASGVACRGDTMGSRLELSVCTWRVGWKWDGAADAAAAVAAAAVTTGEADAEAAATVPVPSAADAASIGACAPPFVSSFAGGVTSSDSGSATVSESDMALVAADAGRRSLAAAVPLRSRSSSSLSAAVAVQCGRLVRLVQTQRLRAGMRLQRLLDSALWDRSSGRGFFLFFSVAHAAQQPPSKHHHCGRLNQLPAQTAVSHQASSHHLCECGCRCAEGTAETRSAAQVSIAIHRVTQPAASAAQRQSESTITANQRQHTAIQYDSIHYAPTCKHCPPHCECDHEHDSAEAAAHRRRRRIGDGGVDDGGAAAAVAAVRRHRTRRRHDWRCQCSHRCTCESDSTDDDRDCERARCSCSCCCGGCGCSPFGSGR